ncbi:MAG: Bifunctional protein FolD [Betaproteobacteria bacterium]|nr:Bifunctional protein FolD [Betaproteobacteria bacterium]
MTAILLEGAVIAQHVYAQLKERIRRLRADGVQPGLAAILVGENSASRIYLKNKAQACNDIGVHSEVLRFPADCSEDTVFTTLEELNANPRIHGILVQLPLPKHLNSDRILQAIAPAKDVDGFNWVNLGAMVAGHTLLAPCTPLGVMTMLDYAKVPIEGRSAVVIGRSAIVGKPLALMLIARGATVTVCSSKTPDLKQYTSMAEILAVAVGRPGLVDGTMIKPGAVVIDVGINRLPGGKLVGDVDFESASRVASCITPVPGGVGRMTVAMLLENTVTAAERSVAASSK